MMLLLLLSLFFSISTITANELESSKTDTSLESVQLNIETDVTNPNEEIISDEDESDDNVDTDENIPSTESEPDDSEPIEPIVAQNIPTLAQSTEPITAFSDKEIGFKKQAKTTKSSRTVTIKNGIDDADLAYKHWTGSYSPKKFTISVNGVEMEQHAALPITVIDNEVTVSYVYDFGYNIKKARGAYQVTFAVDKDATDLLLTFSWHNDWHVILDKATPQEEEPIDFIA